MAAFNPRKFTDPDRLRHIARARLLAFFGRWHGYLAGRGFGFPEAAEEEIDYTILARILLTPDSGMPPDMIDALYYVHETAADDDMDELIIAMRQRGTPLDHDPNATPTDVAMDVWLVAPDILQARHAETVAMKQQNFEYFAPDRAAPRPLPVVSDAVRLLMEAALDDWFDDHRRGRGCRIFVFGSSPIRWILVRHGMPMRREAGHRDDGEATTEFYRPRQHDVLIYDERTGEIGVHASTKGERTLFLKTLGLYLFESEDYFPPVAKFTLDPLVEDGADALAVGDIDGITAARLVEYKRYWGGAQKETEIRKAEDIFAALKARQAEGLAGGRLTGATFKIKFDGVAKERLVAIRPPGIARYERNEDSELVEQ